MQVIEQQIPDPALRSTWKPNKPNIRHPLRIRTQTQTSLLTKHHPSFFPFPVPKSQEEELNSLTNGQKGGRAKSDAR